MFKILLLAIFVCLSVGLHMAPQKYYTNIDVENFIDGG